MILGPAIRIFCLTEDEKNHLVLRNIVSALIELVKCLFCFRLMLLQFDRVAAFTKTPISLECDNWRLVRE